MSAPRASSPSHIPALDGVRGLCALYVVLVHLWMMTWKAGVAEPLWWTVATGWMRYGRMAVCIFIVLSGFCLMLAHIRRGGGSWSAFYRRRALRTLPAYYASIAFAALLLFLCYGPLLGGGDGTTATYATPAGVIGLLTLNSDLTHSLQINPPAWSMGVEWKLYLLFPLLLWLWRRAGPVATALSCTAFAVAAHVALQRLMPGAWTSPQLLLLFLMGIAAASMLYDETSPLRGLRSRVPWGMVAGTTGIWIVMMNIRWDWITLGNMSLLADLPVGVFAATGIVWLCGPSGERAAALLSRPAMRGLGAMSYSLYLIHHPILKAYWQAVSRSGLGTGVAFVLSFAVVLPLALGCAWVFTRVFERPFMHRRRHAATRPGVAVASMPAMA